jgi:hypothetical protein
MYSIIRNIDWIFGRSEKTEDVLGWLTLGFFLWFFGVNFFLASRQGSKGWSRQDYLSPQVILFAIGIIALLEYFVY